MFIDNNNNNNNKKIKNKNKNKIIKYYTPGRGKIVPRNAI